MWGAPGHPKELGAITLTSNLHPRVEGMHPWVAGPPWRCSAGDANHCFYHFAPYFTSSPQDFCKWEEIPARRGWEGGSLGALQPPASLSLEPWQGGTVPHTYLGTS